MTDRCDRIADTTNGQKWWLCRKCGIHWHELVNGPNWLPLPCPDRQKRLTTITGRNPPERSQLDKLVSFCYDRFDLLDGMTNVCRALPEKERQINHIRMQRWMKRAQRYVELRDWVAS